MKYPYSILFFIFLALIPANMPGQTPVGTWRDYFAYSHAERLTETPSRIYCITNSGFFYLNKKDNSLHTYSKIQGLSDHGVSAVAYAPREQTLVITYKNTNIDLVTGNSIININDIYRKQFTGEKTINDILILDTEAYLSCSFGIVVINLLKKEIKDTYIIGENGKQINVFSLAYQSSYLYAATEEGIYRADRNATDLVYYGAWTRITDIPSFQREFTKIVSFRGHLFVNRSDPSYAQDTVYFQDEKGLWKVFSSLAGIKNYNLHVSQDHLLIASDKILRIYDYDKEIQLTPRTISDYGDAVPKARDALLDEQGTLWIANAEGGLIYTRDFQNYLVASPSGPYSAEAYYVRAWKNTVAVAAGGRDLAWNATYNAAKLYIYKNNQWHNFIAYDVKDIVRVLEDPLNPDRIYASAWNFGILVFYKGHLEKTYNEENSSLQSIVPGQNYIRVGGMAFDSQHRLWVTNALVNNPVSVRMEDGSWHSLPYGKYLHNIETGDILISKSGYKWILLPRGNGLFIFDDRGTPEDASDDRAKRMAIIDQDGVPHNEIYCMAEDHDGYIWVGTTQGPMVYFNPSQVFDQAILPIQRVKVPRNDGSNLADYLLGTETITTLSIDGADRKWIGTQKSGVFLVSPDGLKKIHHFTSENSPLPSNHIQSIAVEASIGEVFIGTDQGLVSYRGTAIEGTLDYKKVYAFPNPVRENYQGPITITGLISESSVKITDISGNLVYETESLGGQALWYRKNMSGKEVSSGIYLVFISNQDGTMTQVTKILVIK